MVILARRKREAFFQRLGILPRLLIQRTLYGRDAGTIEDVGIDHGRLHVGVADTDEPLRLLSCGGVLWIPRRSRVNVRSPDVSVAHRVPSATSEAQKQQSLHQLLVIDVV